MIMSYLPRPDDAKSQTGDNYINERVEIVTTNGTPNAHQTDINAFLVQLRNLPDYTVYIRSVNTHIVSPDALSTDIRHATLKQYTVVHYTLSGPRPVAVV